MIYFIMWYVSGIIPLLIWRFFLTKWKKDSLERVEMFLLISVALFGPFNIFFVYSMYKKKNG